MRPRTPKRSSISYNKIIRKNGFPALERDERITGNFPENFIWAVATSSYQIEGGHDQDGKGWGIWDKTCHTGGLVVNNDTGDVACDSYNKVDVDVEMLRQMGVSHYRFSISWPRLLPSGKFKNEADVNQEGIDYYNSLIDGLLKAGIEPMVTIYHWDLPNTLQEEFGGWVDEQIIDHYVAYADLCFREFGDRVKRWITFNEPWVFTVHGYNEGVHSPNVQDPGRSEYKAGHNVLISHGRTYRLYESTYKSAQKGVVGITFNCDWLEPRNEYRWADHDARLRLIQFFLGWFAHPVFVDGDYPDVMKTHVAGHSTAQGELTSRLPEFTEEEKEIVRGSSDFFGLNHYTTNLVSNSFDPDDLEVNYFVDREAWPEADFTWPRAASTWLYEVPWGIRNLLNWIRDEYNDPEILITENGFSEPGDSTELDDWWRKEFYFGYINEVLKAINEDRVNVIGYTAWSLMDNFEWAAGYTERFGMHWVDFTDPDRPRMPKQSVQCYKDIMAKSFPDQEFDSCKRQVEPSTKPQTPATTTAEATVPPEPVTTAGVPNAKPYISFLGWNLDTATAETTLNVLFALAIVFFVATVLVAGAVCCRRKPTLKAPSSEGNMNLSFRPDGESGKYETKAF